MKITITKKYEMGAQSVTRSYTVEAEKEEITDEFLDKLWEDLKKVRPIKEGDVTEIRFNPYTKRDESVE